MTFSKTLLTIVTVSALFFASVASVEAASAGRMWTGSHHRMHMAMHRKSTHHGNSTRSLEDGNASGKGSGPHGGSPNG